MNRRQAAGEQAALRRVAVLVARAAAPDEVFAMVAEEAGRLLSTDVTGIFRYDPDGTTICVGQWDRAYQALPFSVGSRLRLGGHNTLTLISETGRPARVEQTEEATGDPTNVGRKAGFGPVVGAPITVEGQLWGAMLAMSIAGKSLPSTTEARLAAFTELAATAIANSQARVGLSSFADEQAALRRLATLVARGVPPPEVFAAVAEEVGRLLSVHFTRIARYDADGVATNAGAWTRDPPFLPVGTQTRLGGRNVLTLVFKTGRAARIDQMEAASGAPGAFAREHGMGSAVGAPITVEGRLWGAMIVAARPGQPLPPAIEARLTGFTALAAIAIADAQARSELRDFAAEQAALRRVATLVAQGTPAPEVFTAVTDEAGQLLRADYTVLTRYDPDGLISIVGVWADSDPGRPLPVGFRLAPTGRNIQTLVLETRQPARVDDCTAASGAFADTFRDLGFRASVGVPIWVEGRLWGFMIAGSRSTPLPAGTETRLAGFTELAATALANAETQAALTASRARIVASADHTRRRVERDLHDGAQQRLVSLALSLRAVQATLPPQAAEMAERLEEAVADAVGLQEELREISHGLYPAVLSESGLRPALRALARRSTTPVSVDVQLTRRLPEPIEIAAYYAVFEALTNVDRHARASAAEVEVALDGDALWVLVRDNGCGGADFDRGSGLTGVKDRVEAFGGRISLHSRHGQGTVLDISLPLDSPAVAEGIDVG